LAIAAAVVAVIIVGGVLWQEYDYHVRTSGLSQRLAEEWSRIDIDAALHRHQNQVETDWQQEVLDVLILIRTKVLSALNKDQEWRRKEDWFDHWLETRRPEPDLRWAIQLVSWGHSLIDALENDSDPFSNLQGGDYLRALRVDGELEPYRVFIPDGLSSITRHPVVIGFHSREGNEDLYFHAFDGDKVKKAAQQHGFIFVGTTQGGLLGRCRKARSKQTVQRLIEKLRQERQIDQDNIFFLGHSRGCPAAVHCAVDHPNMARAIAIMAPSMSVKEFTPGPVFRETPFLIVTAEQDEHYRVNGMRIYDFIAAQSRTEVTYKEIPGEDHFFTRGVDHFKLFMQIFDFFARHRVS
jgi:dienelactone hydrolase